MAAAQQILKFHTGQEVQALGFGTWQAAPGVVAQSVKEAVKAGFRHIDCAKIYRNETEIGVALQELFAEGVVKREDLFITTKLWNTDHDPAVVRQECQKSIERLQCGYLDLYLIHWPVAWKHPEESKFEDLAAFFPRNDKEGTFQADFVLTTTWTAMEGLVEAGLTKAIGVSNFSVAQVDEIVAAAKIKPVTNQVEVHPGYSQDELRAACAKHGILLTSYCPLAIGMNNTDTGLHNNSEIQAIATEAGVPPAQLLLQWNLQKGNIVLTKSVTPSRIVANAQTPFTGLSAEVMAKLEAFGKANKARVCNPDFFYETKAPFFAE